MLTDVDLLLLLLLLLYYYYYIIIIIIIIHDILFNTLRRQYRRADKSLARLGRKQTTATENFDVHISYL